MFQANSSFKNEGNVQLSKRPLASGYSKLCGNRRTKMLATSLREAAAEFMGLWSALSAVLLMLVVVMLSLYLSLGIHKEAFVATLRCVVLPPGTKMVYVILAADLAYPCNRNACPKIQ